MDAFSIFQRTQSDGPTLRCLLIIHACPRESVPVYTYQTLIWWLIYRCSIGWIINCQMDGEWNIFSTENLSFHMSAIVVILPRATNVARQWPAVICTEWKYEMKKCEKKLMNKKRKSNDKQHEYVNINSFGCHELFTFHDDARVMFDAEVHYEHYPMLPEYLMSSTHRPHVDNWFIHFCFHSPTSHIHFDQHFVAVCHHLAAKRRPFRSDRNAWFALIWIFGSFCWFVVYTRLLCFVYFNLCH